MFTVLRTFSHFEEIPGRFFDAKLCRRRETITTFRSQAPPVASIIKFTTSYLRRRAELSRCLWMLSTVTSFDLYDGVNFIIQATVDT